jgi:hypothetical protein
LRPGKAWPDLDRRVALVKIDDPVGGAIHAVSRSRYLRRTPSCNRPAGRAYLAA